MTTTESLVCHCVSSRFDAICLKVYFISKENFKENVYSTKKNKVLVCDFIYKLASVKQLKTLNTN